MSDERLRELERKWKESGTDHDEAVFLLAQLRAGTIEEWQLELSCGLGYTPALLAAEGKYVEYGSEFTLRRVMNEFRDNGGTIATVRLSICLCYFVDSTFLHIDSPSMRRRLYSTMEYALYPTEEAKAKVWETAAVDIENGEETDQEHYQTGRDLFHSLVFVAGTNAPSMVRHHAQQIAEISEAFINVEDLKQIKDELILWLLNRDDPLALRLAIIDHIDRIIASE